MNIRLIKAFIVLSVALFFSLVAFNNLTDFESNRVYIVRVLSLDTIQNEQIAWRGVFNPQIHIMVYWLFIIWEILTAIICCVGALRIIKYRHADTQSFSRIKNLATVGLMMGFAQYMVGFVDLASEWFYLWQSQLKDAQIKALLFSILMLGCMLFVSSQTNEEAAI